jgi:predicted nucleic acid-binding protein
MDHQIIAVYDANILYPAPLRDLFVRIAQSGLVQAKWTETIHEEWIRNVLKNRQDTTLERLTRTRQLMDLAVRDCLVTGYEILIDSMTLPDPNDRHVLAAAIRAGADAIVTFNLKDFPESALTEYGIAAYHPDEFLVHLMGLAPGIVCASLKRQRESLRNPTQTVAELLTTLERQGLIETVVKLREFENLL